MEGKARKNAHGHFSVIRWYYGKIHIMWIFRLTRLYTNLCLCKIFRNFGLFRFFSAYSMPNFRECEKKRPEAQNHIKLRPSRMVQDGPSRVGLRSIKPNRFLPRLVGGFLQRAC